MRDRVHVSIMSKPQMNIHETGRSLGFGRGTYYYHYPGGSTGNLFLALESRVNSKTEKWSRVGVGIGIGSEMSVEDFSPHMT